MKLFYSDLHEIYLVFLSQFNTLASGLRVIERRDLSNERNTFKSKTIFYHKKTRLKPERDPEKKKASVRDSYNASKQSAKRQRYQEDVEENRAAKRQKYEDNSAAIKASERYWNDPAVRLAKCAAERSRGHRTTTTTQRYVMVLYCTSIKKL